MIAMRRYVSNRKTFYNLFTIVSLSIYCLFVCLFAESVNQ